MGMRYEFAKYDGAGNDFVMIEDMADEVVFSAEAVRAICDRHFGIGADGVIVVKPSPRPECIAYMDYYNSDGTKAQMCGNGIRCFTKFIADRGIADAKSGAFIVDTLSGPHPIEFCLDEKGKVASATVDMGEPILDPALVPTTLPANSESGTALEQKLVVDGREYQVSCVSMGNPHAVVFLEDPEHFPVLEEGPKIEVAEVFPEKTNVEFASVDGDDITMRVWERGCGETLACGTGACATAVAAHLTGRTGRTVYVHIAGGTLHVNWAEDNHVYMTGPASENFTGTFELAQLL